MPESVGACDARVKALWFAERDQGARESDVRSKELKNVADFTEQSPTQLLMRDMGLTDENIERRKKMVGLQAEDLGNIATIQELVAAQVEPLVAIFFDYLAGL